MNKINLFVTILVLVLFGKNANSQTSISSMGTAVTENFNSLTTSSTLTSFTNNSTLSGFYAYEVDPWVVPLGFQGDSGVANSGRLYSYGRSGSTDRALGSLGSGSTDTIVFGWRLKNTSTTDANSINIKYTGEQWRVGGTTVNKLLFYYKISATAISSIDSSTIKNMVSSGYTNVLDLNFSSPITSSVAGKLNGNDTVNQVKFNKTISVTVPAGYEIMIVWLDDDEVGSDMGLAIDDLSVTLSNVDMTAPSVSTVTLNSLSEVKVVFDESVTSTSAKNTSNYTFSPSLSISGITYDSINNTASLSVSATNGKYYTLTVNGMKDLNGNTQTTAYTSSPLVYNNYNLSDLLISEINYNDPSTNDNTEFVEVWNAGENNIELGGLKFTTGITYTFPEYTLIPGSTIAVAKLKDTTSLFFSKTLLGNFTGSLDNAGERLILSNTLNQVVDSLTYDDANGWPIDADGVGYSLQLKSNKRIAKLNSTSNSWYVTNKKMYNHFGGKIIYASPNEMLTAWVPVGDVKINNANGVNTSLNTMVELRTTVYGINYETSGLFFAMRDLTGGIIAFSDKTFGYTVKEGDSVIVVGTIIQESGLSTIFLDTLIHAGTSKIGLKQATAVSKPDEASEMDLIKVFKVTLADAITVWPTDDRVKLKNGNDTFEVYITGNSDIHGKAVPTDTFNITGLGAQSSDAPNLDDGYFIVPRYLSDIDFTAPPNPEFYFKSIKDSVVERNTKIVNVTIGIRNPKTTASSVSIYKKGGNALSGNDYNTTLPTTVTFPGNSNTDQMISISITNDIEDEMVKTLILALNNPTNNGTIGSDSVYTLKIMDNDNPLYAINKINKIKADGTPDSNLVKVQVKGTVYGINNRPAGLQFTIRDITGGIGMFNPSGNFGTTLVEGDEVLISGTVGHFNGLCQISFMDTLIRTNTGMSIKTPTVVTKLGESTESDLVKVEALFWAQTKPVNWAGNTNYKFTNGVDTFDVRIINANTDMVGKPVPTWDSLNIVGLGGQFDVSNPFTSGYQLIPRNSADVTRYKKPSSTIGISKINHQVQIFPNPTKGISKVKADFEINQINIRNINGQLLNSIAVNHQKSLDINTNGLLSGIYIIEVIGENQVLYSRIVKQ